MSSQNTKNPNGGVNMRRVTESPNPNDRRLDRILAFPNVLHAWNRVKANKGAAGIDEMSIEVFPEFARTDWKRICQSLLVPRLRGIKRVEIPKTTGGARTLATQTGMNPISSGLKDQGLLSVKELWVSIHYSR